MLHPVIEEKKFAFQGSSTAIPASSVSLRSLQVGGRPEDFLKTRALSLGPSRRPVAPTQWLLGFLAHDTNGRSVQRSAFSGPSHSDIPNADDRNWDAEGLKEPEVESPIPHSDSKRSKEEARPSHDHAEPNRFPAATLASHQLLESSFVESSAAKTHDSSRFDS